MAMGALSGGGRAGRCRGGQPAPLDKHRRDRRPDPLARLVGVDARKAPRLGFGTRRIARGDGLEKRHRLGFKTVGRTGAGQPGRAEASVWRIGWYNMVFTLAGLQPLQAAAPWIGALRR